MSPPHHQHGPEPLHDGRIIPFGRQIDRRDPIRDDRPDLYKALNDNAPDEPQSSEYRFLVAGGLAAVLWLIVFEIARHADQIWAVFS